MGFGSFFSGIASVIKGAIGGAVKGLAGSVAKKGGIKGLFSFGLKQFAISFIATAVFSFAYKKLAGKPKEPDLGGFDSEVLNRSTLVRSPISPRQIVYGTVKKSGTLLFANTTDKVSGEETLQNKYLHLVIGLAGHEIQSIDKVFFNDVAIDLSSDIDGSGNVNTGTYNGKARIKTKLGTTNQTVDSDLQSENSNITSNHRFREIAYIYVRLEYDADVYPNGIPNISALIKGKKLFDFRTSTTAYSSNPALVIYDYLRSTDGMNASTNEIDTTSFTTSANDCEDSITLKDSSTQNRYECHGIVTLDKKPIEIIEDIVSSCIGTLTYEQGKFNLKVGKARSSVKTITDDDLAGELNIRAKPKRQDLYNQVRGTFADESNNYIATDFPVVENSTYQTNDGETISREIQLNYTSNQAMAERIAFTLLKQSRQMMTVNMICKPTLLNLSVGDVVSLTISKVGFSSKQFLITSYTLNENLTVDLTLQEYNSTVYDYDSSTDQTVLTTPNNINLPSAFSVPKPGLTVTDEVIELFDGSIVSKLVINITNTSSFISEFEVEYKDSAETDYRLISRGVSTVVEKYPVKEGRTFNIRARAISSIGVKSAYATANHEVNTAFDPPDDVQNYSIDVVGDKLHHTFDAVTNLDLDFYEIRFTSDTTETVYANTTVLVPRIGRPATSVVTPFVGTGTYFIKAVDKFNVRSTNATKVVIDQQVFEGFETIQTITEEPNFSGTKTDCVVVDNTLVLDTSNLFDATSGNFDDATGLFDSGFGSVNTSGSYEFNTGFDFSNKFKFKILLNNFDVTHLSYVDTFDAQQGLFDDKQGDFDGTSNQSVSTNVQLQIALSDDNVTFGNFTNFKSGDFVARAVKFKALLTTSDTSATPKINNLSLKFILPKYVQDGSNISSGTDTAGKTVTFANAFYQTPTVTIIGQDLNQGDYFQLNSKDRTAFNVEFFNSGGTTVDRTFDFQAVGVGNQQP